MVYPTPEDIIFEYLTFMMAVGDDLGIFLAHFRWLWERAYQIGVTHYDGVMRLIRLLPQDWQGWAMERSRDYIFSLEPFLDIIGDFPRFLAEIHICFILNGQAPRGPYILPGDLVPVGVPAAPEQPCHPTPPAGVPAAPEQPYHHPETVAPPPSPTTLGRRVRGEFEAGPSRFPMDEEGYSPIRAFPAQSSPGGDATDSEARELRAVAAERRRRGKAPVTSAAGEESTDQEIRVGTTRLQPLPIPSETHTVTPPVEVIHTIPSHPTSTAVERRLITWAIRHYGEVTRSQHASGGSPAMAIQLDDSSEEEDPDEDPEENPGEDLEYEVAASTTGSST